MRGVVAKELRRMIKQSFRKDDASVVKGPLARQYMVSGGQKAVRDNDGNLLLPEITGTITLAKECERASYKFFKQQYKMLQRQGKTR